MNASNQSGANTRQLQQPKGQNQNKNKNLMSRDQELKFELSTLFSVFFYVQPPTAWGAFDSPILAGFLLAGGINMAGLPMALLS